MVAQAVAMATMTSCFVLKPWPSDFDPLFPFVSPFQHCHMTEHQILHKPSGLPWWHKPSLSLPVSLIKVLPLPASAPTSLLSMKQLIVFSAKNKNQRSLLCKLLYLTCVVEGMVWNGRRFSIFHTGNFLPFYFHSIPKIFHSIFQPIVKFSSVFQSILPYQRNFRVEAMQRKFYCFNYIFAML